MSSPSSAFGDVKQESRERIATDVEQLKSSFSQLKNDVAHLLKTSVGAGKASVQAARDQATSSVGSTMEDVKGKVHDLTDKGQEQLEQVSEFVGERPLTSALIAFGIGFIVAKILSR